jgi:hypothetical protein
MKTKLFFLSAIITFCTTEIQAQYRTRVNALNSEISDNLDLKAVASVFGVSENLEDFERKLNDPKLQLSNLDLNYDNQVDYLRVVESIENQTHIILIQAVVNRDVYQDVATIDVNKDYYNKVSIQITGNTNIYGANCVYEPTYYSRPSLISLFWTSNYRPYYSNWRWNYYPKHYYSWSPYSSYKYRRNITFNIKHNANFNRVNYRRSHQAESKYNSGYNNQRPIYSYSNENQINRRGSIQNNEIQNLNQPNRVNDRNSRNGDETQRSNYKREIPQNKTLEIKEVEIQRNRNQYATLPTIREKERGSRENHRRE